MYNGDFTQCLSVTVTAEDHDTCLQMYNVVKKQCDAWYFNVTYQQFKPSKKGPVTSRTLIIYQTAGAGDIIIFKEAVRRICRHFELYYGSVKFLDKGAEPVNDSGQSN
jgi:hypothetical protein